MPSRGTGAPLLRGIAPRTLGTGLPVDIEHLAVELPIRPPLPPRMPFLTIGRGQQAPHTP